jgi:hypothetical protein
MIPDAKMLQNIEDFEKDLKAAIMAGSNPIGLFYQAKALMNMYPRYLLSDWVEALAAGNPTQLKAVIEIVTEDIIADEEGGNASHT